jgi:hypothetical protein
VDPGIFSVAGLVKLQDAIGGVVRFLDNRLLRLAGLVVSRVQRDNLSRDTESQLRSAFGGLVLSATVPASTKVGEAHARYASVLDYAPCSPGAKAFEALTREIIGHGQDNRSGSASMELLRPTSAPTTVEVETAGGDGPDEAEAEGRGDQHADAQAAPARTRARRRAAPAGKTKARNIRLSDDVHNRLWLLARQRKQRLSAVANELLDKTLPRWELKRQG